MAVLGPLPLPLNPARFLSASPSLGTRSPRLQEACVSAVPSSAPDTAPWAYLTGRGPGQLQSQCSASSLPPSVPRTEPHYSHTSPEHQHSTAVCLQYLFLSCKN